MLKLKNIINESSPGYEDRQFGDPLPTFDDIVKKKNESTKTTISEKKELGSAYIDSIRMLTDNNNHTRARAELARQIGDKRVIKAYEGLMYVEDLLRQANETIKARTKLDKILFARSKKVFSNHDIIMSVF